MKSISSSLKSAASLTMQSLENKLDKLLDSVVATERLDIEALQEKVADLETKQMEQKVFLGAIVYEQQQVICDLQAAVSATGDENLIAKSRDIVESSSKIKNDVALDAEDGVQESLREAGRRVTQAESERIAAQTALKVATESHVEHARKLTDHVATLTNELIKYRNEDKALDNLALEYSKLSSTLEEKEHLIEMLREQLDDKTTADDVDHVESSTVEQVSQDICTVDSLASGLVADLRKELSSMESVSLARATGSVLQSQPTADDKIKLLETELANLKDKYAREVAEFKHCNEDATGLRKDIEIELNEKYELKLKASEEARKLVGVKLHEQYELNLKEAVEETRVTLESDMRERYELKMKEVVEEVRTTLESGLSEKYELKVKEAVEEARTTLSEDYELKLKEALANEGALEAALKTEIELRKNAAAEIEKSEAALREKLAAQLQDSAKIRQMIESQLREEHDLKVQEVQEQLQVVHEQALQNLLESNEAALNKLRSELSENFETEKLRALEEVEADLRSKYEVELLGKLDSLRNSLYTQHRDEIELLKSQHEKQVAAACKDEREKSLGEIEMMLENTRRETEEQVTAEFKGVLQSELESLRDRMSRDHRDETSRLSEEKEMKLEQTRQELECQAANDLKMLRKELDESHQVHLEQELHQLEAKLEGDFTKTLEQERGQYESQLRLLKESYDAEAQVLRKQYIEESRLRRQVHNELVDLRGNIRVFVRVRPVLAIEEEHDGEVSVTTSQNGDVIVDKLDSSGTVKFEFDEAFGPGSTQTDVFETTEPLVLSVLDGFNVCLFAYGQTGSGKTYTMEGPSGDRGVNFKALERLFTLQQIRKENFRAEFVMSVLEIYNENVFDLLENSTGPLDLKLASDGQVHAKGLSHRTVSCMADVENAICKAQSNRSVGAHNMNEHSSRSHLVVTVTVTNTNLIDGEQTRGRLNLIDLAGSERISKTDATGERLKEAQSINKSLSALGDVIQALGERRKGSHVPFRNSKLTHLLQPSLGGNSKVAMFVNASPALYNVGETLCSLKFASRCRKVVLGSAKRNGVPTTSNAEVSRLKKTVAQLQRELDSVRLDQRTHQRSRTGSLLGNATNII